MLRTRRSRIRRTLLLVPLVLLAAAALGACGDDSYSSSGTTTTAGRKGASTTTTSGGGVAAAVALGDTDLGRVLVDGEGRTLYAFTPDSATESACTGGCAQAWPPAAANGTPSAGDGVTAELTVITRDDGTQQIVADGHPLYRYAGDAAAGEATGQGSGGTWYVMSADGSMVRSDAGASTTTTSTSSRYGY